MADVPGQYTFGLLHAVGERFYEAFQKFQELATDIKDVPVVGGILHLPFQSIASILYSQSNSIKGADYTLWVARRGIDNLFNEWGVNALILELAEWWDTFRTDPREFIQLRVADFMNIEGPTAYYPHLWVNYLLDGVWADWSLFSGDPKGYVLEKIKEENYWVWTLTQEPIHALEWAIGGFIGIPEALRYLPETWPNYILKNLWWDFGTFIDAWRVWFSDQIEEHYPQLSVFITAPYRWLQNTLYHGIGVPYEVWTDFPTSLILWVLELLEDYIGHYEVQLTRFLSRLLRYALEGVWRE